ncbi:MAG: thiolase family protein, partial [Alphaproteobacteria bacterium]|nr:thiolase family protein [Alphaproteobacteria bacterium]
HFRKEIAADDVIAARMIAAPLTLPMCAPVSDGAAACLLASRSFATRIGAIGRAVRVDACVLRTGAARDPDDWDRHIGRQTALAAYERAGVGPGDVGVAEVHDAAAIAEIIQIENLGISPRGEGGPRTRRGETVLGGRCPVNPSGGLVAKGHPIAATGLAQVFELALQLRGEAGDRQVHGAKVGAAENGGGFYGVEEAVCAVSVLSK